MDDIDTAEIIRNEVKKIPLDGHGSDTEYTKGSEYSVENFQSFLYELFEKNGILNDLRAYLRRQIVDVLKSSHAGDTPICQKKMTQRLELKTQAMNIMVAEYLMRMDFKYSLSVFVSEIPLANMVFEYAGKMMQSDTGDNQHFGEKDIWSIISYMGIKCDLNVVNNILASYKNEDQPLLTCIIKNLSIPHIELPPYIEPASSSEDIALSEQSYDTVSDKTSKNMKRQLDICKKCHSKFVQLKDKYKKRKNSEKEKPNVSSMNLNYLLKNMDAVEGGLVDEMFSQLKCVYEGELEILRAQHEERAKEVIQQHAQTISAHRQQLEEDFKAREEELERGVRTKKKFLWGLARSLRSQHDQLARAMAAIKQHSQRLKNKEDSLKCQLSEVKQLLRVGSPAESSLQCQPDLDRKEGISSHLIVDEVDAASDKTWAKRDILTNELSVLRRYIETSRVRPTCVVERGTNTDMPIPPMPEPTPVSMPTCASMPISKPVPIIMPKTMSDPIYMPTSASMPLSTPITIPKCMGVMPVFMPESAFMPTSMPKSAPMPIPMPLNNGQAIKTCRDEDILKNNQLVNDFKKQKNVNFCVGSVENPRDGCESLAMLRLENQWLKEHARQQEQLVSELRALPRPAPPPRPGTAARDSAGNSNDFPPPESANWRGAGEDTMSAPCRSRVDHVPFIGLLDRRADCKRLMNKWRTARRTSPRRLRQQQHMHGNTSVSQNQDVENPNPEDPGISHEPRAKSPKSVLREAKEKLRTSPKDGNAAPPPPASNREKSPTSVLREAKMRLRKLEIEAEAVERSYRDYRKRCTEMRAERCGEPTPDEARVTKDVDDITTKITKTLQQVHLNVNPTKNDHPSILRDLPIYSETEFSNRTSKVKTIPSTFAPTLAWAEYASKNNTENFNFVETPMEQFQKYYKHTSKDLIVGDSNDKGASGENNMDTPSSHEQSLNQAIKQLEARKDVLIKVKNSKKVELEILKENITKIYNLLDNDTNNDMNNDDVSRDDSNMPAETEAEAGDKIFTIEVETGKEKGELSLGSAPEELVVVVESSVAASPRAPEGAEVRVLAGPRRSASHATKPLSKRSISPEQAARLTRNDVLEAIYQAGDNNASTEEVVTKDADADVDANADLGKGADADPEGDDYPDDFSADLDSYERNSSPVLYAVSPDQMWED